MSTTEPDSKPAGVTRTEAREAFLSASVAVWREIDRLDAEPDGYHPIRMSVELRQRERAAWERYRDMRAGGPDQDRTDEDGASKRGHGGVLVGEVRALLAKHGVPHGNDAHYVIVATAGDAPAQMSIMACCDDVGHAGELLAEALENLTGAGRAIAPDSPDIIVGREDLRAYLRRTEGGDPNLRGLWESLAAAAGLGE